MPQSSPDSAVTMMLLCSDPLKLMFWISGIRNTCFFSLIEQYFAKRTFCLEAETRLQSVYLKKVSLGLGDANNPTRADLFVVHRLIVAYETWLYKTLIDEAFQNRNFAGLQHDIIDLGQTGPCIAVSSLFSQDDVRVKDDVARVRNLSMK